MPSISEGFESALEVALAASREEYARLAGLWKDIETKAATVTTVAGLFLGFVLNFIKDQHASMADSQRLASGLTLLCLLTTLSCALAALLVRERVRPPSTATLFEAVRELYARGDPASVAESSVGLLQDRVRVWEAAVAGRIAENEEKARLVRYAQGLLLGSMFLATLLAFLTLCSTGTASTSGV